MASEQPTKRTGPGGPKKVADIAEPSSDALKYLPYAAAGAAVIGLVATVVKSHQHAVLAATVLTVGGALGLAYLAWQDSLSLPPEDSFRKVVTFATVAVLAVLLGSLAITLHPPAPAGTVTLARAGDSGSVAVAGNASNLFLEAMGEFEADVGPSARAAYVLHVTRNGTEEEIEGSFERSAGQGPLGATAPGAAPGTEATASRHWLKALRGPGRYTVTLDRMPDNLRPPMRAALYAEPFAPWMFALLCGIMAAAALAVDAGIAKRGVEPSYGPALLFALVFVYYLHGHFARANPGEGLFASLLVGLFGGGLGGEIVARVTRKLAG